MKICELVFAVCSSAILLGVSIPLLAKQKEKLNMQFQKVKIEGFNVVGFKTRTSGAEEMQGSGKIAQLWERFRSYPVGENLQDKLDHSILAIYFDYENDAMGAYSLLIGYRVKEGAKTPEGMDLVSVPTQSYARFISEKGEIPGIVFKVWKKIWDLSEDGSLKRNFSYDYETYDQRSDNIHASQIDVFISTK
jgi:predicted transcriptional regulator YdeE